jgi:hypothetical protein
MSREAISSTHLCASAGRTARLPSVADAVPFLLGFVAGLLTYRWCIGRVAQSRGLDVTSRQLWTQTFVLIALPLAAVLTLAWWVVGYQRVVEDQQAGAPARKVGASATPEHA